MTSEQGETFTGSPRSPQSTCPQVRGQSRGLHRALSPSPAISTGHTAPLTVLGKNSSHVSTASFPSGDRGGLGEVDTVFSFCGFSNRPPQTGGLTPQPRILSRSRGQRPSARRGRAASSGGSGGTVLPLPLLPLLACNLGLPPLQTSPSNSAFLVSLVCPCLSLLLLLLLASSSSLSSSLHWGLSSGALATEQHPQPPPFLHIYL